MTLATTAIYIAKTCRTEDIYNIQVHSYVAIVKYIAIQSDYCHSV